MFAIIIEHAKNNGQSEVVTHLLDGGLSSLQYADNTILYMEHGIEKSRNLKLIILAFKKFQDSK
jgi:hypothetical protein